MLKFPGMASKNLQKLWAETDRIHSENFPNSRLKPIMGGGKTDKPRVMFVFINPTYRNVTSDPNWKGMRAPWVGTKQIWRIFNRAGLFSDELMKEVESQKIWDVPFAKKVYGHISDQGFYFTNLVKWTGENADLPDAQKVKLFLPILQREIELVQPEYILTFGLMPFKALTGKHLKLDDYYLNLIKTGKLESFDFGVSKVIPCYFPVGRGNPKRAVEILKFLR